MRIPAMCYVLVTLALLPLALVAAPDTKVRPLTIVDARLQQYEDGEKVPADYAYVPGESMHLSFRVSGYKATEDKKVKLNTTIDAVDPQGVKLQPTESKTIDSELAPQDKEWMPIVRYSVVIPPLALGGTYKILVHVQDDVGKTEARLELPLMVKGRQVEPSDSLVIRNFRFLRSENDTVSLAPPVFHPGDTLWARFEITGFKLGEKNYEKVQYGLAVLSTGGDTLFKQPDAAADESSSFYPKRYVPGVLSLNLQSGVKPGQYILQVTTADFVGKQTAEVKQPFSVE